MTGWTLSEEPFRNQSRTAHAAMVACGAVLAVVSYVFIVRWLGGPGAISAEGADDIRRTAVALSGCFVAIYFSTAFVRGLGGPGVNFLYLITHIALTSKIVVWLQEGQTPEVIVISGVLFSPTFFMEALHMGLVPVAVYLLAPRIWFRLRYSPDERREWAETHLSEYYRGSDIDPTFGQESTTTDVED